MCLHVINDTLNVMKTDKDTKRKKIKDKKRIKDKKWTAKATIVMTDYVRRFKV